MRGRRGRGPGRAIAALVLVSGVGAADGTDLPGRTCRGVGQ